MNLKIIKEYTISRIQEFIRIMTDSQNNSDGFIIMSLFALQRCSLLFRFDQFGNVTYSDFKLQILSYVTNWTTFQTPLHIIDIQQLREATLYIICFLFWLSTLILFTDFKMKSLLTNFFTFYQLLIVIPSFEISLLHLFQEKDIFLGMLSLSAIIINYLIQFIVHRNFQLPQKNYFIRRYSYYNVFLIFADIGAMITKYYINEILQTIVLICQNFLFLIDSYYVQPYQHQINKEYMTATSLIFCFSIIKIFAFFLGQADMFFIFLLLTPLFVFVLVSFYNTQIYKQLYSLNSTYQQLLLIADIISYDRTNPIQINSIINHLKESHKLIIEQENISLRVQQTILQLFNLQLEVIKHQNDQSKIENLQLYKIMYITITCKRTQLGYIELKTFETNSVKQSFYFNVVSQLLQEKMSLNNQKFSILKNDKRLSLSNIRKAELLYEGNLNKIVNIIDTKIKFWMDLNKGFQKIEELAEIAINLSEKIWQLRDDFFEWFDIDPLKLQQKIMHFNAQELKLLGILYSTILNDYHATLDIELRIEEMINIERNQQTENITNCTLLNDELIMIATSFAKQRGFILNQNRGQIAKFFGFADEKEFQNITQIEQLMPAYIRQIHDKIIARYMRKGYSMLTEQAKEVYIKMKDNFIKAANISLLHMFEKDTDYIITGALQKVKQGYDFIIFDRSGKILGITEQVFLILGQLTLDQLLSKGHIYFWFHNLFNEITQQKQELLQQQDQFQKTSTKQQIIYPIRGFQQICQDHDFSRASSTVRNQESGNNFLTEINDTEYIGVSFANINSCHFLKEQNLQFMNEFALRIRQNNLIDQLSPYQLRYSLQFSVLGSDLLPIFVMQITEIEKKRSATSHTTALSCKSLFYQSSKQDPFNENQFDVNEEIEGEKQETININPPIINKINNSVNQNPNSNVEDIQPYPNYSSEQYKLISPRGNKENLINEEYEEEEEEEKIRCQENAKSSSQVKEGKKNIAEIIQLNLNDQERFVDNAKQSQSSTTSDRTQMSVFNILRNLQYTNRYQTTLIKIFINTAILIVLLTLLVILELVISRDNINTLQFQIPLIRLADKFNRLYCTFTVIGQMDLEMKLLGIDYGEYYAYRIKSQGNTIRPQMLSLVALMQNQFSRYDAQGKLQEAEIKIISQYIYLVQNTTFIQFSEMTDDYTQALNSYFQQNSNDTLIEEQVKLLFLKGNLISLINLISNLVENIVNEFFNNIDSYELIYLIFLFLQLTLIVTAVTLQFRFWVDPYVYKQNILLLICRVPEKEVELLQIRYKTFRDLLQYEICKWKQTNYFKDFFSCRVSQLKKIQKLNLLSGTKKQKQGASRVTVNSRIQDTQYSILHIYIMLIFFWLLLTSFVFSSYLFQSLNIKNSQPELNLCMQFVRFKQEFDSCMIISQFIKNQPLLSNYQRNSGIYLRNPEYNNSEGFFKTYTYDLIEQFSQSLTSGKLLYQNIYDNIVASTKISDSNKNLLLGLYQDDLCNYIEDELPFCDYEDGKFKYFPDYPIAEEVNNNRERLRQGFNGIYQQILSLFSTKYSKELNGIEATDQDEIQLFLETPEYVQLLLPYFYDLNKAIVKFYVTIITASVHILEIDYQNYLAYYVSNAIIAQLIFLGIVIKQAQKIQRQVRAIRQALVLLPHESLQDIQIYSAIKRFEQQM